jgi:hypothetical protein
MDILAGQYAPSVLGIEQRLILDTWKSRHDSHGSEIRQVAQFFREGRSHGIIFFELQPDFYREAPDEAFWSFFCDLSDPDGFELSEFVFSYLDFFRTVYEPFRDIFKFGEFADTYGSGSGVVSKGSPALWTWYDPARLKKVMLAFANAKYQKLWESSRIARNPNRESIKAARTGKRVNIQAGTRYEILMRDGFRCRSCGVSASEPGVKLHVDHIHPVKHGGTNDPDNLQALCQACNLGKGARICP